MNINDANRPIGEIGFDSHELKAWLPRRLLPASSLRCFAVYHKLKHSTFTWAMFCSMYKDEDCLAWLSPWLGVLYLSTYLWQRHGQVQWRCQACCSPDTCIRHCRTSALETRSGNLSQRDKLNTSPTCTEALKLDDLYWVKFILRQGSISTQLTVTMQIPQYNIHITGVIYPEAQLSWNAVQRCCGSSLKPVRRFGTSRRAKCGTQRVVRVDDIQLKTHQNNYRR